MGEAAENFDPGGLADGVADVVVIGEIADGVETVFQINIIPAVGIPDGLVYLFLQLP